MGNITEKTAAKNMLSYIDFCLSFVVEKRKDNGEDSAICSCRSDVALFGVFDGCGGAGSQTCPKFMGKTEAYIASRATADAFETWFDFQDLNSGWPVDKLKQLVLGNLNEINGTIGEKSLFFGGMKKKFPTTAAAGICYKSGRNIEADLFWAGDSRVYLLNNQGLAQLTEDDLGGLDAMENLTEDGVLSNLINLSVDFTIHTAHISMDRPGLLFAATDGCFGYLSTPMEFEYLLLETLLDSDCVSSDNGNRSESRKGWLEALRAQIGKVAGDDYTMCGYCLGFGSFENLKKTFKPRADELYKNYINSLDNASYEQKMNLWQIYKENYYRLVCRP